jgi:plasmid stabilization system protein ParE
MKVRFTPEAEQQADASDTWWRGHREARDLFARELADTMALLLVTPRLGRIYTIVDGQPVRKVLMPRTQHHVYFTSDIEAGVLLVHAVWGAPRGRDPRL